MKNILIKTSLLFSGGLLLTGIANLLFYIDVEADAFKELTFRGNHYWPYIYICVTFGYFIYTLYGVLFQKRYLQFSENGIVDQYSPKRFGLIEWDHIEELEVSHGLVFGKVCIYFRKDSMYTSIMNTKRNVVAPFTRKLCVYPLFLTHGKYQQIVSIYNKCKS